MRALSKALSLNAHFCVQEIKSKHNPIRCSPPSSGETGISEGVLMSDETKPADTPTAPVDAAPKEAAPPPPERKPDRVSLQREKNQSRREKVRAPVPSLEKEQTYGFGQKVDAFDDEMERELQEVMSGVDEKTMYGEPERGKKPDAPAGPKKGRVYRIHGQDVFIEVPGGRSQGVMPIDMFPEGPPKIGDEVTITIEGYDNANGVLLLSRKGAAMVADWSSVVEGMIVEARVTETNKGGLAVDVNGIRGFMPVSHIELFRVENLEPYVNQRLRCMVVEVNPEERNLVVSRRALLDKEREENREKLWEELAIGQVRDGVVRSVKEFGAFVDLGGVDGLLHVSELSWSRVADASKMLQVGQAVKVVVLKKDEEKKKLSLGMRQLQASPWDAVEEKYAIGTVANGKVTRTENYGAFVELEPAIEGLVHISELAPQRVWRTTDVVKVDQEVKVLVLDVDTQNHRIALSIKQALPKPEPRKPEEEEEEPVEEVPVKPAKVRTTPLRGGTGSGPLFPNLGEKS
jgi:small subunit ribosomal protein S1